jgi:hypothetical protein
VVSQGGLLALSSNIGAHQTHEWVVMPEVGVAVNWQLTDAIRLRLGYNALFLPHAYRAGEQVDTTVNPNLIPPANAAAGGPSRPTFLGPSSTLWAQTVSFGVEVCY